MSDVKHLLKAAREAIQNKNYDASLYLSKAVLSEDKTNYMALVFLGLSLQELGQIAEAPKVFQKAIECNKENLLAWNGLINCYEKVDTKEIKPDLVQAYIHVLNIETNDKKILEYCEKVAKIVEHGDATEIIRTVQTCRSKVQDKKSAFSKVLIGLCEKQRDKPEWIESIFEECLLDAISTNTATLENYSSYISLLYSKRLYDDLFRCADQMHVLYTTDVTSLLWICKIYNQLFVEENHLAEKYYYNAVESSSQIMENDPKNAVALFTKGITFHKSNRSVEARDILVEVTNSRPGLIHAWIFLTKLYVGLNLHEEASQAASRAQRLLKSFSYNDILKNVLDGLSLEYLSKSAKAEDCQAGLDLYEKIEDTDLRKANMKFAILANINLERFETAKSLISKMEKLDETSSKFLKAKCLRVQKEYKSALEILGKHEINQAEWWLEIGTIYWDLAEYKNCLKPFLKAAKCDQNNYTTFLFLGRYYEKFDEPEKAMRCYERAFKINPKSKDIAKELTQVYQKEKNWGASQGILESLTTDSSVNKNSWAWLNLGLNYLEQGDYTKAIENLQKAVRIETDNPVHCWEALADAYFARGSYMSAQKCYQICLELSENNLYSSLQIANIKKILGDYTVARTDFEEILLSNGQYVLALKGLAETCLYQAREAFREQRLGRARDHSQVAVDKLTAAVQQNDEFSCLRKLLGDACLFIAKLPEKYSCLFVSNALLERKPEDVTSMVEKDELFDLATKCYCKAVGLSKDDTLVWHDLAVCYCSHALNVEDAEKKKKYLLYSLAAAQYCTEANPGNWQHWNLMGTVYVEQDPPNYALAQHAFIKAITVDNNSAVAWSNLGALYLMAGDVKLANKAFAQGQRSDPDYNNSWIGQAMIAETMGCEEAIDLFRHSTQLGQQQQGGIGYGYWVCKTLKENPLNATIYSIHNMHAIPVACDALTWYTAKNPSDGTAWNMLGILRERMGLTESTLEAYKNAYQLSAKENRDMARINYGRILSKLGKYTKAIDVFQEVQEATFNSGSGLALALFHDKQYEGSYSAYEQALHWLTEEQSSQSDLLVALASMAYMFQGVDTAKTLLFQSIQLKPPSPWSLYATLSLALLHNDTKLAELVLAEMKSLKDDPRCLPHYASLLSYTYLIKGENEKAVNELSKLIHRHPNNASLWFTLSHLLLRKGGKRKSSQAPFKCAKAAMILGRVIMDVTQVLSVAALALVMEGESKQATVSAQKAIHTYPNIANGWAVLSLALMSNKNAKCQTGFVENLLEHVGNVSPDKALFEWVKSKYNPVC